MKIINGWITELTSGSAHTAILFCALLFTWMCTVQVTPAAGDVWVLKETRFGADTSTYWDYWWGANMHVEYTVTLATSQITVQEKVTKDGTVSQNARFYFDYDTPPAELIPGKEVSLRGTGTSQGPYQSASETFLFFADTWTKDDQKISQIGGMHVELDSSHPSGSGALQFSVPDTFDGRLKIKSRASIGAQFYVQFIYEPGAYSKEGFVLTNTSTCQATAGDTMVPQNAGACEVKVDGSALPQNSSMILEENLGLLMGMGTSAAVDFECFAGLVNIINIIYSSDLGPVPEPSNVDLIIAFLVLGNDPSLCDSVSSIPYAGSSNHISLGLQSGSGRFRTQLADLSLGIGTDAATVHSEATNDFAVDHDPDTDLTIAACYRGRVTVDPVNPDLSPVTLKTGEQVEVSKDSIGPVTRVPLTSFLPSLMLLRNE